MIHEVYGEINEIKVCSCHFDLVFYAMKKFSTADEIEELFALFLIKLNPGSSFLMERISFVAYVFLSGQQIIMMVI